MLPFTKRTTTAAIVFACIGADRDAAQLIAGNQSQLSQLIGLQTAYASLLCLYKRLIRQDVPCQAAIVDYLVAQASVAIYHLNETVQAITIAPETESVAKELAALQSVISNAVVLIGNVMQTTPCTSLVGPPGAAGAPGAPGTPGAEGPPGVPGAEPNGVADVTAYGARAVAYNTYPATTATMSGSSADASLAAASTFENGDGVVVYGAGATCSLTAPSSVTVQPSQARSGTNTGRVVDAEAGSTAYQYQIVARDKKGGMTAASTAGTTSTGASSLGVQSATITGFTRSNNTVTVTTSAAHGIKAGALVNITVSATGQEQATDYTFAGFYRIATVPTAETFTFTSGMDTRGGAPAASYGGGTAYFYVCNYISWTGHAGDYQYYIYGRVSGTMTLLGCTKTNETWFEDYGSTYSAAPSLPDFVPSTPPASSTNQYLVTKISSGAGTTSLVLADAAVNAVSGAKIKYDCAPNILTAATAAVAAGYSLYFPSVSGGFYVINSHLIFPSGTTVWQGGSLFLNESVELGSGNISWSGVQGGNYSTPQFAYNPGRPISANTAYPAFVVSGPSVYIGFVSFATQDQGVAVVQVGEVYSGSYHNCNFAIGVDGNDYSGMAVCGFSSAVIDYTECLFIVSGPDSTVGASLTPLIFYRQDITGTSPSGDITFRSCYWVQRGVLFDQVGGGCNIFDHCYAQELITPLVMYSEAGANQGGGVTKIDSFQNDTSECPFIANWVTNVCFAEITNSIPQSPIYAMVSGAPFSALIVRNSGPGVGQNVNVVNNLPAASMVVPTYNPAVNKYAVIATYAPFRLSVPTHFPAQHTLYWDLKSPTGVSASVASGGSVSVGTHTYQITAVGIDGGETVPDPTQTVTATTTSGNQTVNLSWTAVTGAVKYGIYRDGGGLDPDKYVSTNSFSDTGDGADASTPPTETGTGLTTVMSTQVVTPQVVLQPTLYANLGTPSFNGTFLYCADCTIANPCAGSGHGAFAKYLNGIWVCN